MHRRSLHWNTQVSDTSREIGSIATYSLYLDDKRFFSSYSALSFYKFIRFRSRLRIVQRSATSNDAHLSSEINSQRSNCRHAKIFIASYIKHSTVSCAEVNVLQQQQILKRFILYTQVWKYVAHLKRRGLIPRLGNKWIMESPSVELYRASQAILYSDRTFEIASLSSR